VAQPPHLHPYPPPAPDDCITSVEPGKQTLNCDGLSFELTVPAVCLERACGLIMDVHGFGMNAEIMELHTKLRVLAAVRTPLSTGEKRCSISSCAIRCPEVGISEVPSGHAVPTTEVDNRRRERGGSPAVS
jgi:hypothetical protein